MNVLMCSADFSVMFKDMECKVYAIRDTVRHGEYNLNDTIEFLLYLDNEWFWIHSWRCKPLSGKEYNE